MWGPGAIEPQRHLLFLRWLTDHPGDRNRYAAAKIAAAGAGQGRRYNDLKSAVVYDIYERAFLADPAHDARPAATAVGRLTQRTDPDRGRRARGIQSSRAGPWSAVNWG